MTQTTNNTSTAAAPQDATSAASVAVRFSITHQISSSKGWGRFKVTDLAGNPAVVSSTGNHWVSADKSVELPAGSRLTVTLQRMLRTLKTRKETIYTDDYALIVEPGAESTLGFFNGLEITVQGAKLYVIA